MFTCTLTALRKSSEKKEAKQEKGVVVVFKHPSDRRKKTEMEKLGMMNILASGLYLLARLTLTLIFSFCYLLVVFKS